MLFMSACVVVTQMVITLIASWSGRQAGAGAETAAAGAADAPASGMDRAVLGG